jgi:hypothetical protein
VDLLPPALLYLRQSFEVVVHADDQRAELGLQIHEVGLVCVYVLQGVVVELFAHLGGAIGTFADVLADLLVVVFAGLLLQEYLVALDHVVYPICQVDDVYCVGGVLADVDEL